MTPRKLSAEAKTWKETAKELQEDDAGHELGHQLTHIKAEMLREK